MFFSHLLQLEWQLFGSAEQSSFPSLARSAHVLDPDPAGATSLQHLPHDRSHELDAASAGHAPAAAAASHDE